MHARIQIYWCRSSIFRHLKLELLTQFPASNDEKYINVVYIWRKFVSFYDYVHWRMTTETSVMYGSEKVNKLYKYCIYCIFGIAYGKGLQLRNHLCLSMSTYFCLVYRMQIPVFSFFCVCKPIYEITLLIAFFTYLPFQYIPFQCIYQDKIIIGSMSVIFIPYSNYFYYSLKYPRGKFTFIKYSKNIAMGSPAQRHRFRKWWTRVVKLTIRFREDYLILG